MLNAERFVWGLGDWKHLYINRKVNGKSVASPECWKCSRGCDGLHASVRGAASEIKQKIASILLMAVWHKHTHTMRL